MCQTIKNDFPEEKSCIAEPGEQWFIGGEPYRIYETGLKYFESSGNPNTEYLRMSAADGTQFIITHKAFGDKAKREEPLLDRYITVAQFLKAKPCDDGVIAFGVAIGEFVGKTARIDNPYFELTAKVAINGVLNEAWKVSDLYGRYRARYGSNPPDSWLLWMAQTLNLVPKNSTGPDVKTLKRLLGIKEAK